MLIQVDGARLAVEIAGAGPAVVLVHAGICDRSMWAAQVAALQARFRVICYDLRGFGASKAQPGRFAHWQDLRALLDALAIGRPHLVGMSMGGGVVLDLAVEDPRRVGKLVLAAPSISGYVSSAWMREQAAAVDASLAAGDLTRAVELELRLWVDGPRRGPDDVARDVRDRLRLMAAQALAGDRERPQPLPPEPPALLRLEEIAAEALVVEGDLDVRDALTRNELAASRIPRARKLVLAGAGHFMSLEQPEAFNRALLEHLGS